MQAAAGDKRKVRVVRLALQRLDRPLEVIESPVDTTPDRLGEMDNPRLLEVPQSKWPVPRCLRLPSQWIQGREVEMTVQCQNRANSAAVYRCQIRTYDEKTRGSKGGIDG